MEGLIFELSGVVKESRPGPKKVIKVEHQSLIPSCRTLLPVLKIGSAGRRKVRDDDFFGCLTH